MKVLFLLCSESASLDGARNTLSVFHILEELTSPNFPAVLPSLFISALLEKPLEEPDPEGLELHIHCGGTEVLTNPVSIQFQGKLRIRVLTQVGGVVISTPGVLSVSLTQAGKPLAVWSMRVIDIGHPKIQEELPLATAPADK